MLRDPHLKQLNSVSMHTENSVPLFLISKHPLFLDNFDLLSHVLQQFFGRFNTKNALTCQLDVDGAGVSKKAAIEFI